MRSSPAPDESPPQADAARLAPPADVSTVTEATLWPEGSSSSSSSCGSAQVPSMNPSAEQPSSSSRLPSSHSSSASSVPLPCVVHTLGSPLHENNSST